MSIQTILLLTCSLLSFALTAQSDDYKTTPLGTKYKIIKTDLPEQGSFVYFHAEMRTQRDSVMFSTRDRGEAPVITVAGPEETSDNIGPVEDVLRYLRLGERATLMVSITDFPTKPPGMDGDSIMYYDVEIIEIVSAEEFESRKAKEAAIEEANRSIVKARAEERTAFHAGINEKYRSGKLANVITTESGLKYIIHEMGEGGKPESGEHVSVHYIGSVVVGGEPFDESFQRGEPLRFKVGIGQVIAGWDEGLQLLPSGTKASLFIPAALGYGEKGIPNGIIPPNAELVFYVELE